MDAKQKGFTLIEILVVVTIIGVLAGLVVVLIPRGQFAARQAECTNNVRNIAGLLELAGKKYPPYAGPNLILYLVKKEEIKGRDQLQLLFCPGDLEDTWEKSGGEPAYKDLDPKKRAEYDHLTSYAGRDQTDRACAAKRGSSPARVLLCDDSEDHHDGKGFVVGLQGGAAKFRDKVDDWEIDISTVVQVGEGSVIPELECLRTE